MSAQALIERMAELQLKEQEQKLRRAEYEAELARLQLEHARSYFVQQARALGLPPVDGSSSGGSLS
jgi:hypothetical protein